MTTPALEALVGQTLDGHYTLSRLLGAGGMGAVYLAHHAGLQRDVAIKVLHPDIGSDPSISKRFDREAQSASRLDHPNCVRVTDFGTTEAQVKYLVMELLEGEELGARLGHPWAPLAAIEVLDQILAGLEHAHAAGIVHRDLKPENVFMTRDFKGRDTAKIVDFGIAKLLDADGAAEALTRAGMVFGTPRYMSPEQAAGGKVDARSDLYAVGILAHELLSGKPPFESDDLAAILRMQIMAPPPPLPDTVPASLAAWVEALLEKSRNERPASATLARAQLAEIRGALEQPAAASPASAPTSHATVASEVASEAAAIPSFVAPLDATGAMPAETAAAEPGVLPSKPQAMVGHTIADRFELLELLGIGGMGAVFRARDAHTGATMAVKVLHAAFASDDEIAARFEREAKTASELEHPNIVPVFTQGTTPGAGGFAQYLVMPLLEGVELRALIGAPMDPARAVALITQLLDALAHAHALEVIHRDLKPENVFVIRDPDGSEVVQLMDFGLAKVAEAGQSYKALTAFGQVFGTPAYMSPEQCRGEVVDARADIYAVGVILHELLAGRAPFCADTPLVLLGLQLHEPPPPLPESLPLALRQAVAAMLVKDRDQRMPDARTALASLAAALAQPSSPAFPPAASASLSAGSALIAAASGSGLGPGAALSSGASMSVSATMPPVVVNAPGSLPNPANPAGPAALLQRVPRWALYVGGGVVALLLIVALWPSDKPIPTDSGAGQAEAKVANQGAEPDAPRPDHSVYLEIDRLLSAKDHETALIQIRAARDEFSEDAGLLWREGRALAESRTDADRATALHRYAEAAAADAELASETEFEAGLRNLLRDPKLRDQAVDVAVRELGPIGHTFLLEVINDADAKLGYVDRHRVLDELMNDPALYARVDHRRQLGLDLSQASEAPAPCTAFGTALDTIAKTHDLAYVDAVFDSGLVVPSTPGMGEAARDCDGLADKLAQVQADYEAEHPDAATKAKKSGGRKKGGGSKKKFRLPF